MNRDIDKERSIGILSVTTVRYGQVNGANSDTINEWEIETLPSARYTDVLQYCREHIMSKGKPYDEWTQGGGLDNYFAGYYRLYRSLGNIWTYKIYQPYTG